MTATAFDAGLTGPDCWLEHADGGRTVLPADRWAGEATPADEPLLAPCDGPVLDIGCGPGRLTAALAERGVAALGIDVSPTAVALTRARGVAALHRDVFGRVPAEGRWRQALLADGNIGIGGDPVRLLRRVRGLLTRDGLVVVETEPPGTGHRRGGVRVCGVGPWVPWAWVAADAVDGLARDAGLRVRRVHGRGGRWFAEVVRA